MSSKKDKFPYIHWVLCLIQHLNCPFIKVFSYLTLLYSMSSGPSSPISVRSKYAFVVSLTKAWQQQKKKKKKKRFFCVPSVYFSQCSMPCCCCWSVCLSLLEFLYPFASGERNNENNKAKETGKKNYYKIRDDDACILHVAMGRTGNMVAHKLKETEEFL